MRIALLSDAATQQFIPVLKTLFSENGVTAELYEAPFDAMELEVINPASGLYAFEPDVVLLIHSIQALRARYYEQGMSPEFDRMLRIWDALAANSAARIVQCNFPLPYERPFGQFDQKLQQSLYAETRLLNARIALAAGERANGLLADVIRGCKQGRFRWQLSQKAKANRQSADYMVDHSRSTAAKMRAPIRRAVSSISNVAVCSGVISRPAPFAPRPIMQPGTADK